MFQFKNFSLSHENSTLKIGTDSVLLAAMVPLCQAKRILDIGCGCGVIAFCIADRLQANGQPAQITGIDIDAASVEEATQNAFNFPGNGQIDFAFHKQSLQEMAPKTPTPYDLIVSNPPFYAASLKPADDKKRQSKHCDDTLPFADLLLSANQLLTATGHFYVILPTIEGTVFEEMASAYFHLNEKITIFPVANKPPHRVILGFSKKENIVKRTQLTIRNTDGTFHPDYIAATKAFYIKF